MMTAGQTVAGIIGALLARTPEWVRHDLGSKDPHARTRAEETLAMLIEAALREETASPDPTGLQHNTAA